VSEHEGIVVPFGQRAAAPAAPVAASQPVEPDAVAEPGRAAGLEAAAEPEPEAGPQRAPVGDPADVTPERAAELARSVEALLFLSTDPVTAPRLADACECEPHELEAGLIALREQFGLGRRGLVLREVAGGFTLATSDEVEPAARRLLAKPRTPPLSPAQAETLAIVAYLQPASRPEITRIRGVSADSASQTLLERGLIEEAGRSQFGAVLYRTTPLFLKLFGLRSLKDLPPVTEWDPSPDEEADLRERLLRAGEARAGTSAVVQPGDEAPAPRSAADPDVTAAPEPTPAA